MQNTSLTSGNTADHSNMNFDLWDIGTYAYSQGVEERAGDKRQTSVGCSDELPSKKMNNGLNTADPIFDQLMAPFEDSLSDNSSLKLDSLSGSYHSSHSMDQALNNYGSLAQFTSQASSASGSPPEQHLGQQPVSMMGSNHGNPAQFASQASSASVSPEQHLVQAPNNCGNPAEFTSQARCASCSPPGQHLVQALNSYGSFAQFTSQAGSASASPEQHLVQQPVMMMRSNSGSPNSGSSSGQQQFCQSSPGVMMTTPIMYNQCYNAPPGEYPQFSVPYPANVLYSAGAAPVYPANYYATPVASLHDALFQGRQTLQPNFSMPSTSTFMDRPVEDQRFAGVVSKAVLTIDGDLKGITKKWTPVEEARGRRLVQFYRSQNGNSEIRCQFEIISQEMYQERRLTYNMNAASNGGKEKKGPLVVSCIYWAEHKEHYITSVDCIYLLEGLIGVQFTVEEKNRIRRNLEGFKPLTVAKQKKECTDFFRLIMGFPHPKPRNIEKDVKVFPWSVVEGALAKVIRKYTPSFSSTAMVQG